MARKRSNRADVRRVPDGDAILGTEDASLLDIVDNVLNKGVVLSGDLTIGLAQVDLVYARLSLLLCAADRVLPMEATEFLERHHQRHARRERLAGSRAVSRPYRTTTAGRRRNAR